VPRRRPKRWRVAVAETRCADKTLSGKLYHGSCRRNVDLSAIQYRPYPAEPTLKRAKRGCDQAAKSPATAEPCSKVRSWSRTSSTRKRTLASVGERAEGDGGASRPRNGVSTMSSAELAKTTRLVTSATMGHDERIDARWRSRIPRLTDYRGYSCRADACKALRRVAARGKARPCARPSSGSSGSSSQQYAPATPRRRKPGEESSG